MIEPTDPPFFARVEAPAALYRERNGRCEVLIDDGSNLVVSMSLDQAAAFRARFGYSVPPPPGASRRFLWYVAAFLLGAAVGILI